jgi:hypothetical protein
METEGSAPEARRSMLMSFRSRFRKFKFCLKTDWDVSVTTFLKWGGGVLAAASFGFTMLHILFVSSSLQLPVLRVIDTLGGHLVTVLVYSVLLTGLAGLLVVSPGWFRMAYAWGEYKGERDANNGEVQEQPIKVCKWKSFEFRITPRVVWAVHTFLPVSVLFFLFHVVQMIVAKDGADFAFAGGFVLGLLLWLVFSVLATVALYRAKRSPEANPLSSYPVGAMLLPICLVDALMIAFWMLIYARLAYPWLEGITYEGDYGPLKFLAASFLLSFATIAALFASGVWAERKGFATALIILVGVLLFMFFVFPGAKNLYRNHLSIMSQGGGKQVILVTDDSLPKELPFLFKFKPCDGRVIDQSHVNRTGVLQLELLGDDRVFVRYPENATLQLPANSYIEIDMERIKAIIYIGKEDRLQISPGCR